MNQANAFFNLYSNSQDRNAKDNASVNFWQSHWIRMQIRQNLEERELSHERALELFEFDPTLPATIRPVVSSVIEGEPLLFITIIRSKVPIETITTNYTVTSRGMLDSLRRETDGDVTIGRQQINENGVRVNDIMLHPADSSISRVHCRIIYKHGLVTRRKVPLEFEALCMMSHPRLGRFSPGNKIPLSIYRHIFQFLKEKKRFYVEDLGSVYGTYVRLKEPEEITTSCTLVLGEEAALSILGFYPSSFDYVRETLGLRESDIPEDQLEDVVKLVFGQSEVISVNDSPLLDNYLDALKCPFMKVCVHNNNPCAQMLSNELYTILIPDQRKTYRFIVGPRFQSHIHFPKALSSVEIVYNQDRWYVQENTKDFLPLKTFGLPQEVEYGVWISVNGTKIGQDRYHPGYRELRNGDEIKVSETVLKVKW